jgi:hypothetical protein
MQPVDVQALAQIRRRMVRTFSAQQHDRTRCALSGQPAIAVS